MQLSLFPCGLNKIVTALVPRTFGSAILHTGCFHLGSKADALRLVHSYQQEGEKELRNSQLSRARCTSGTQHSCSYPISKGSVTWPQLVREAGKYRLLGNVTRGGREVGVSLRLATGLRYLYFAEYNLELIVFCSLTK